VRRGRPVTSTGAGIAPSKSEPTATCSTPTTSAAWRIARAVAARVVSQTAPGQRPIPTTPPVAAIPRSCSSERLRGPGQVASTPPWETTTGRVALPRTSATASGEAWARSTAIPSSSMRARARRPSSVSPPFSTPWAEPATALSKKWVRPIIRYPAR